MKIILTCTILLFTILGCTHSSLSDSDQNIERVTINQDQYIQPDFYLEGEPNLRKNSRAPASINLVTESFKHLSNRQLYFLSSYIHYKSFKKSLNIDEESKSCPMFHDLILSEKKVLEESYKLNMTADFLKVKDDRTIAFQYPVLALPYSNQKDLYSELVNNNWENPTLHLKTSMMTHYKNSKSEIAKLCETGVSPGYYIYENLVTYFKTQKSFHRTKDGLKALLKVPVIANMLIVDSMDSEHRINPVDKYNRWLLSRSNTYWIRDYFSSLKEKRVERLSSNLAL